MTLGLPVPIARSVSICAVPSLVVRTTATARSWLQQSTLAFALVRAVAAPSFQHKLPDLLLNIWESILRAVPKKKTSHRKKRQRFLAGKTLKDINSLNKCSACGNIKRRHLLCPYCIQEIKDLWAGRDVTGKKQETKLDVLFTC